MRLFLLLFALLPISLSAAPICSTMDRVGYDAVKGVRDTTYKNTCSFKEKYIRHVRKQVCYEDFSTAHDDGRVQKIRTITCGK